MRDAEKLPRFSDLTLILTDQCNLRCPFCYVPEGAERSMPTELALAAVDLLLDRAPPGTPVSISFFGGEPFLRRPLMEQVIAHGLARRPGGSLSFGAPTNGTLLDEAALELVQRNRFRLALSADPGADGHALSRLAPRLSELCEAASIVRMTVTPANVGELFDTIVDLAAAGAATIMHQPALEGRWPAEAVEAWREQHARLADWACERYARRQPLPGLTVLEGIVSRLERGVGQGFCGAGSKQLAVDPEGRIFGCFRSAYDPRAERLVLADLVRGGVNEPLLAAYARLDPARAQPEQGPCKECASRDGCTVYCPAAGHVVCGDLRAVPVDACALMQIQVETCREMLRRMRRSDRSVRRRVVAKVATAALTLGLASGVAACDDRSVPAPDSQVAGVCAQDASIYDGYQQKDGPVGGVCPVGPDYQLKYDQIVPGQCPIGPNGQVKHDGQILPGQCPIGPDAQVKLDGSIMPGECPVGPDAQVKYDFTIGPGVCPIMIDAGKQVDGPVGGICPMPGLC